MRTEFAKLLKQLRKISPDLDEELIRKAYRVANKAHEGQVRLSGEPYIAHCLAVARVLAGLGLDSTTISAALLHDVIEDTDSTRDDLAHTFGDEIASLVDGVTKISALSLAPSQTHEEKQAINIRKMLVATARDVRVILIKLADRLHNMRTIEFLPEQKRNRICQETLDIYAPLAHRLGIARWKWELEDHAFHVLQPQEYRDIAKQVAMKRRDREAWLNNTIGFLEGRLAEAEVNARVIGRPKHLYSIYRKMLKQGSDVDQIMDKLAVRIITQTVTGCYNALGVIHHIWTPVPGRFKDYIAMPKANMYQSIHTTVMRDTGVPLEVQIRTEEMDRTAREGIAAHWKYKLGGHSTDAKLDDQLRWLRQMYEWLQDAHAPDELLDSVRRDFTDTDIYVFTPKGAVKELASGATPLDFAYMIHTDIGHQCIGARVNGHMVPLRYNLQMGDVVEILTSKAQHPRLDWLDIVVSGRARTKIRHKLRELGELEPVQREDQETHEPPPTPKKSKGPKAPVQQVDDATRSKLVRIEGAKGMEVQFGKCCHPMPGHSILGYVTRNPGITVHRTDCKSFANMRVDPARVVEASWDGERRYERAMRVRIGQRPNVLADITNAIRPMNVDITQALYRADEDGHGYFDFVFECADKANLSRIKRTLATVAGVTDVTAIAPDTVNGRA